MLQLPAGATIHVKGGAGVLWCPDVGFVMWPRRPLSPWAGIVAGHDLPAPPRSADPSPPSPARGEQDS